MNLIKIFIFIIVCFFPLNLSASITLEPCNEQNIKGIYNLLIYSNSFINDPETFIILDRVDDRVKIIPYAPSFKYKVIENLNEKEALKVIEEILKNSSSVSFIKCSAINEQGNILGYELKPIYFPWIFGILEPVETLYKKENNTITIFIRLNPRVERQIYNGDRSDRDN